MQVHQGHFLISMAHRFFRISEYILSTYTYLHVLNKWIFLILLSWARTNPDNWGGSSTVIGEGCGEVCDDGLNDVACTTNRGYICRIQI